VLEQQVDLSILKAMDAPRITEEERAGNRWYSAARRSEEMQVHEVTCALPVTGLPNEASPRRWEMKEQGAVAGRCKYNHQSRGASAIRKHSTWGRVVVRGDSTKPKLAAACGTGIMGGVRQKLRGLRPGPWPCRRVH
jgi:hypothetical protein